MLNKLLLCIGVISLTSCGNYTPVPTSFCHGEVIKTSSSDVMVKCDDGVVFKFNSMKYSLNINRVDKNGTLIVLQ